MPKTARKPSTYVDFKVVKARRHLLHRQRRDLWRIGKEGLPARRRAVSR